MEMNKRIGSQFTANSFHRFVAYLIDLWVVVLGSFVVWLESKVSFDSEILGSYSLKLMFVVWLIQFSYHWLFLYFCSATPGKIWMGLKVMSKNSPQGLGFMQSFLRVLTDQLSYFLGLGPRVLALIRLDRTHLSDWVAETYVVQDDPRKSSVNRYFWVGIVLCIWISWSELSLVSQQFKGISIDGDRIFFSHNIK